MRTFTNRSILSIGLVFSASLLGTPTAVGAIPSVGKMYSKSMGNSMGGASYQFGAKAACIPTLNFGWVTIPAFAYSRCTALAEVKLGGATFALGLDSHARKDKDGQSAYIEVHYLDNSFSFPKPKTDKVTGGSFVEWNDSIPFPYIYKSFQFSIGPVPVVVIIDADLVFDADLKAGITSSGRTYTDSKVTGSATLGIKGGVGSSYVGYGIKGQGTFCDGELDGTVAANYDTKALDSEGQITRFPWKLKMSLEAWVGWKTWTAAEFTKCGTTTKKFNL